MCWSAKASLASFIIGWSLSITLIVRNKPMDRLWGFFFMFVTSMQFFEFLIWLDQPESGSSSCESGKYKGKLNNTVSQLSSIQNFLQPLVLGILSLLFIPSNGMFINPTIIIVLLSIYFITVVSWIIKEKLYTKKLCTIPCVNTGCNNHHLQWQWTQPEFSKNYIWVMYFSMLVVFLIAISKTPWGLNLGIFLLVTFAFSAKIYPYKKAVGSWWCVAAVLGPIVKLIL
jgi:hypothetical protein